MLALNNWRSIKTTINTNWSVYTDQFGKCKSNRMLYKLFTQFTILMRDIYKLKYYQLVNDTTLLVFSFKMFINTNVGLYLNAPNKLYVCKHVF